MKSSVLLLALVVAALSSCTTAYKTGQTPDDVYFSPTRPQDEYVRIEKEDDRRYRYEEDYQEDRYLRMKIRNRNQWGDLNDWYSYERYGFGHNYYYGSYYNPYNTWNYYYNPYCSHSVYVNTRFTANAPKPRMVNLNTYNTNNNSTVSNPKTQFSNPKYNLPGNSNNNYNSNTYSAPRNSSSNSGTNTGNLLRTIFSGGSNNNSSSNSSSGHNTSSSSSSSSSSSGSSSGSSAPVRRF